MKIGFYSPYLNSLSGGERYVLSLASHWAKSHDVSVFWDDGSILRKAQDRLHIDLSRVHTVENVFGTRNIFKKMIVSRGFDLIFFLTDGSIPTTFAKHNILHFQVPFQHVPVHPVKLSRFQAIVCNSDFTKRSIDKRIGTGAVVIYPPVTPVPHTRITKKKIILSVGRLHPLKKQDVLIEAFRNGKFSEYELVLAGGSQKSDDDYLKRLKFVARPLKVRILPNISFKDLSRLYEEAHIYWHAAGYHETNPERMEHFGITTVEAMSAGVIPVVFNGGGLPEIVREGEDGFLWANTQEFTKKTASIITSKTLTQTLSKKARERSHIFSEEEFTRAFDELLTRITQ